MNHIFFQCDSWTVLCIGVWINLYVILSLVTDRGQLLYPPLSVALLTKVSITADGCQ